MRAGEIAPLRLISAVGDTTLVKFMKFNGLGPEEREGSLGPSRPGGTRCTNEKPRRSAAPAGAVLAT